MEVEIEDIIGGLARQEKNPPRRQIPGGTNLRYDPSTGRPLFKVNLAWILVDVNGKENAPEGALSQKEVINSQGVNAEYHFDRNVSSNFFEVNLTRISTVNKLLHAKCISHKTKPISHLTEKSETSFA